MEKSSIHHTFNKPRFKFFLAPILFFLLWSSFLIQTTHADVQIHWSPEQVAIAGEIFLAHEINPATNSTIVESSTVSRMSGVVDYRSLYFPPMSGRMVAYNETGGNYSSLVGAIIVGYLPTLSPYLHHEAWILDIMAKYKPKGIILLASRTIFQLESSNNAFDMSSVTAPVIAVTLTPPFNYTTYYPFLKVLQTFPDGLNVTINSLEPNPWWAFRFTGWPIFFTAVLAPWALINIGVAVWTITRMKRVNIAFLCLLLEALAGSVRLVFAIDPYAARFVPNVVLEVLYTSSFPMSLGSLLLLAFFWQEITMAQVEILSALLTAMRIPAAITIVIMVVLEVAASCARAVVGYASSVNLATASFALYFMVGLFVTVYFIFVSVKLIRFLKAQMEYNSREKIMAQILVRILGAAAGLLTMMIFEIAYFLTLLLAPDKTIFIIIMIHICASWISSVQVFALWKSSRGSAEIADNPTHTASLASDSDVINIGSRSL